MTTIEHSQPFTFSHFLLRVYYRFVFDYLTVFLVLAGAMVLFAHMECTLGTILSLQCKPQPPLVYLVLIVGALPAAPVSILLRRMAHTQVSRHIRFTSLLVGLVLSAVGMRLFVADFSLVETLYYCALALIIGAITMLWSPYLFEYGKRVTILEHLKRLWRNRELIQIWVRYNIKARYSQSYLGIVWVVFLPVSTTLIITFVFSKLIHPYAVTGVPFVTFFLSALTFWSVFSQGVLNGSITLRDSMKLMNQVYFPREILVLVKIGETLVDLAFVFCAMLIINLFLGVLPNINFIYLPIVVAIQLLLTFGIDLILSYATIMVRDIPHLIGVLIQLAFYATPILYPASVIPDQFRFVLFLNPMAPLLDSYRSIIAYNQAPNPVSLGGAAVIGGVLLYFGYKFFKSHEKAISDFQ